MMKVFTVSFFGHRYVSNAYKLEKILEELITDILLSKEYVEFLVGRDGDFDQLVSSVVRRSKRTVRDDNSTLVWVMPYEKSDYRYNVDAFQNYYDEIEICEDSAVAHYKAAYQIRNRSMVDRSNLVIFCIERDTGGAWQTLEYAKKKMIPYINIAKGL